MADQINNELVSGGEYSLFRDDILKRIRSAQYEALREAIFNAIVHKDYTGSAIQMKVYTDHIELWNEGLLPEGFTVENLLGKHRSRPRNRKIANVFYLAGFIEAWGRGISKIITGLTEAGLKAPNFEEDCGGLSVTIYRKSINEMFNNNQETDI
jgi:ATP-dependent DNA helicase RecG